MADDGAAAAPAPPPADPAPAYNSFAAHRGVRVAVVPLGGILPVRFQQYLALLRRFPELPMANLSKPGSWRKEKSPWKHFSWFEGSLLLRYDDQPSPQQQPAAAEAGGAGLGALARPGLEWQDYQAHRRTWAVVGVVHIPSCTPAVLKGVQTEFQARCKEFPHAVVAKVFCFGHSFEAEQQAGGLDALEAGFKQHKDQLVVFPPEGDDRVALDGGVSMVELHMGAMLNDVAVSVLLQLEEEVTRTRAASKKTLAKRGGQWLSGLRAGFDDESAKGSSAGSGASGVGSNTANQGRISKWVGDLSLLAGSPQDAIEAYAAAIGECKAVADTLWQAGALEGWVAALETMVQWHLPLDEYVSTSSSSVGVGRDLLSGGSKAESGGAAAAKALLKEVEDKVTEALTLLEPQAPYASLAVELSFKMARHHGQAKPVPRHVEALNYVMRAMAVNNIPLPVQVLRALEAAALCRWLGLHRKYAFLLRLAAVQASELGSHAAAHALARVAAEAYGVRFLDEAAAGPAAAAAAAAPSTSSNISPPRRPDPRNIYPPPPGGWPCLQRHLLGDLVAYATAARDVPAACGHYLALLHLCAELEGSRQRALLLAGGGGESGAPGAGTGLGMPPPQTPTTAGMGGLAVLSPSAGGVGGSGWAEHASAGSGAATVQAASSPLAASGGRPKLLALESAGAEAAAAEQGQPRRWSDAGGEEDGEGVYEQGEEEEEEEEEEEDDDDEYDDLSDNGAGGSEGRPGSGGRPLSAERWQLRGGVRMTGVGGSGANLLSASGGGASSSLGGFSALKLSLSKGARGGSVLKPFRSGSSRDVEEDRASSAGSSSAAAAVAGGEGAQAGGGGNNSCWTSLVAPNVAASPQEQEALIAEMMRLTRRLPPRTPLAAHGLPHVHFVRPLRLARDLVPVPVPHKPAIGAGGGALSPRRGQEQGPEQAQQQQAFIYNPFADKGGGGQQRAVTWAAGEVALVALAMSNPLAAPVNVQSIELLVEPEEGAGAAEAGAQAQEGPVAFCYPLTLWVPPYSSAHPLTLALKPLRPGTLVIKGVKMTVFNITSTVLVDTEGGGPVPLVRTAPRDWYPRQALAYSRTPTKGGGGGGEDGGGKKKDGDKGAASGAKGGDDAHHQQQHAGFHSLAEAVVPTTRVAVVAPLPRLTTRLDRWATNVELLPGEYRRARLELEVANEVPIGYLEVCVHQKALTRKHRAAGRPVPLYVFAATTGEEGQGRRDGRAVCLSAPDGDPHHPLHPQQQEHLAVALDPLGLDALTAALRAALRAGSCLFTLALPILLRRVDRYPEADVLVRYSAGPTHRHQRTLTIPLRFHLKDGLAATDLAVETAGVGVYPALGRVVEASHRQAWEGTGTPLRTAGAAVGTPGRRGLAAAGAAGVHLGWTREVVDTDHEECLLLAEVANAAAEDLHVKTCLLEEEGVGGVAPPPTTAEGEEGSVLSSSSSSSPHHALASELALLQDLEAPTAMVVRPKASRRLVIPFPRLDAASPLLKPPPPPPPPPGGGQAPKPTVTLDSPEWTRALHGLCRALRVQWADRHGLRSGLLRLPPTLAATVRPQALQRLKLPLVKLSCTVGSAPAQDEARRPPEQQADGADAVRPPLRRRASTTTATFTVLPPMALQQEQQEGSLSGQEQQQQQQQQQLDEGGRRASQSSVAAVAAAPSSSSSSAPSGGGSGGGSGANTHAFPPYAFIPVHFRLTNRSPTATLPPAKCFCHTYQDYGNGNLNFAIDAVRAMWSGSLAWTTPALAPGASHLHVAYVSFTATGEYGVGVSASYLPAEAPPKAGGGVGGPRSPLRAQRSGSRVGFVEDGGGGVEGPLVYMGHETLRLVIEEGQGEEGN